ncbi:hypothetical protein DFP73DRAFT_157563 [Morchella snyderi]|nr:hypothetical protein DFP73DRAFT_157563 [Morchella snyderi]
MQRISSLLSRVKTTRNMASSTSLSEKRVNVFGRPLLLHSEDPMTGFFRNGYCDTNTSDSGNHTIAGVVSDKFLDYSAAKGNNLRLVGLRDGCKWCLCVNRWKEAFDAYKRGEVSADTVPRVVLGSTHIRALEGGVEMDQLEEFKSEEK